MIVEFLRYNAWANRHLLASCAKLSSQELGSRAEGTYGTIYDTFVHIVRAEASYLRRMTGENRPPPFSWDDHPTLAEMSDYARQIGEALIQVAEKAQAADVVHEEWDGKTVGYKAILLLIQTVNHGVEHRTNITTILSQLGLATPEVDGWGYLLANEDRFAAPGV
jgi:uncharacterized damage-inducible protein DinB